MSARDDLIEMASWGETFEDGRIGPEKAAELVRPADRDGGVMSKQYTVMLNGGDHDERNLPGQDDMETFDNLRDAEDERTAVERENPGLSYLILVREVTPWEVARR